MKNYMYVYSAQKRGDKHPQIITEEKFRDLLAENYACDVHPCGMFSYSVANYEKADKMIASLKRSKTDLTVYACQGLTLFFSKKRLAK